jgi:MFS superfamily sulfate permease-like transporter
MVCRLKVLLHYGNAEFVMNEVLSIVRTARPGIQWFILRFGSFNDVDYVGTKMLMELADRMVRAGVALVFAELSVDLMGFLFNSGVLAGCGNIVRRQQFLAWFESFGSFRAFEA